MRLNIDSSAIRFINDATAFAMAEAIAGKASAYNRVVAITLGTGFGSSFLINGKPIVEGEDIPAGGFLFDQPFGGHLADELFSTRGLIGRYEVATGNEMENVLELCERAPEEAVLRVFENFGADLGRFLEPFLKSFNAEVLVVGGNIAKASHFFIDELSRQLPQIAIHISDYGEAAAIIGSALLLDDNYYCELEPTLKLM